LVDAEDRLRRHGEQIERRESVVERLSAHLPNAVRTVEGRSVEHHLNHGLSKPVVLAGRKKGLVSTVGSGYAADPEETCVRAKPIRCPQYAGVSPITTRWASRPPMVTEEGVDDFAEAAIPYMPLPV
jgi:hypothetical protein